MYSPRLSIPGSSPCSSLFPPAYRHKFMRDHHRHTRAAPPGPIIRIISTPSQSCHRHVRSSTRALLTAPKFPRTTTPHTMVFHGPPCIIRRFSTHSRSLPLPPPSLLDDFSYRDRDRRFETGSENRRAARIVSPKRSLRLFAVLFEDERKKEGNTGRVSSLTVGRVIAIRVCDFNAKFRFVGRGNRKFERGDAVTRRHQRNSARTRNLRPYRL